MPHAGYDGLAIRVESLISSHNKMLFLHTNLGKQPDPPRKGEHEDALRAVAYHRHKSKYTHVAQLNSSEEPIDSPLQQLQLVDLKIANDVTKIGWLGFSSVAKNSKFAPKNLLSVSQLDGSKDTGSTLISWKSCAYLFTLLYLPLLILVSVVITLNGIDIMVGYCQILKIYSFRSTRQFRKHHYHEEGLHI